MKCPYCGNQISENSVFCTFCGAKMTVEKQPSAPLPTNEAPAPASGSAVPAAKEKKRLDLRIQFFLLSELGAFLAALITRLVNQTMNSFGGELVAAFIGVSSLTAFLLNVVRFAGGLTLFLTFKGKHKHLPLVIGLSLHAFFLLIALAAPQALLRIYSLNMYFGAQLLRSWALFGLLNTGIAAVLCFCIRKKNILPSILIMIGAFFVSLFFAFCGIILCRRTQISPMLVIGLIFGIFPSFKVLVPLAVGTKER